MKTILITGSTDGVGKIAATKLAEKGHKILLHGRNAAKLENVISEIKNISKNTNISGFVSDLSDFDSIQSMIDNISNEFTSIDVLINNAGVYKSNQSQNQNGLDMRFAVNYFAPYLLTNGLLPILKNNTKPRIINLSSAAQSTVSFEALKGNENLNSSEAYAQSKLALTMWSFYLAQNSNALNVIALNPGSLLNTNMVKEAFGHHWSSADKGANILVELALSDDYKDSNGRYFDNDKGIFAKAHTDAYNQEKIIQLISETNKILAF